MYTLPHKPKDHKRPKKPMNQFFLYKKAVEDKSKHKSLKISEVARKWRNESVDEKKKYDIKYNELINQYKKDIIEYEQSDDHKKYLNKVNKWTAECAEKAKKTTNGISKLFIIR